MNQPLAVLLDDVAVKSVKANKKSRVTIVMSSLNFSILFKNVFW